MVRIVIFEDAAVLVDVVREDVAEPPIATPDIFPARRKAERIHDAAHLVQHVDRVGQAARTSAHDAIAGIGQQLGRAGIADRRISAALGALDIEFPGRVRIDDEAVGLSIG